MIYRPIRRPTTSRDGALGHAAAPVQKRGVSHWLDWHARVRSCDVCKTVWVPATAGGVVRCPGCGAENSARPDPFLIILVTYGERALLGAPHHFPLVSMYTTLAGFVEPGESLEEAVAREVVVATGVSVGHVRYHSSEPWPFPGSIMLGFYAEAFSDVITIDCEDLRDARWFTRAEIAAHESIGFTLPRPDSMAGRLIGGWMAIGSSLTPRSPPRARRRPDA